MFYSCGITLDSLGLAWIHLASLELIWIHLNPPGLTWTNLEKIIYCIQKTLYIIYFISLLIILWIYSPLWLHSLAPGLDSLGLIWSHLDCLGPLRSTWAHLNSFGYLTWIHFDSHGLTWIDLVSLGLTWST